MNPANSATRSRTTTLATVLCAAVTAISLPAWSADELKTGEYACYGSGGRPLIGLAFKVLPGGRYTDLDGKEKGRYVITGDKVVFKGGHMASIEGKNFSKGRFRAGTMASCEPF